VKQIHAADDNLVVEDEAASRIAAGVRGWWARISLHIYKPCTHTRHVKCIVDAQQESGGAEWLVNQIHAADANLAVEDEAARRLQAVLSAWYFSRHDAFMSSLERQELSVRDQKGFDLQVLSRKKQLWGTINRMAKQRRSTNLRQLDTQRDTLVKTLQDISQIGSSLQAARAEVLVLTSHLGQAEERIADAESRAAQAEAKELAAVAAMQTLQQRLEAKEIVPDKVGTEQRTSDEEWDLKMLRREDELKRVMKERDEALQRDASPRSPLATATIRSECHLLRGDDGWLMESESCETEVPHNKRGEGDQQGGCEGTDSNRALCDGDDDTWELKMDCLDDTEETRALMPCKASMTSITATDEDDGWDIESCRRELERVLKDQDRLQGKAPLLSKHADHVKAEQKERAACIEQSIEVITSPSDASKGADVLLVEEGATSFAFDFVMVHSG